MQSAQQLLTELNRLDIKLSLADGKLRCNAPKGAMTPALRDSIKQFKPALLQLLENQRQPESGANTGGTLTPIARNGELPLSYSQERIWLLSKLDPANHFTGNIHFVFRISGLLDIAALEQALNTLIQRHEVFRIRCASVDNRPVQTVIPPIRFRLPLQDLSALSPQTKENTITATCENHALEPFDLAAAPLLRAQLLKTADRQYLFLLATHLYIFDGWSTAVLLRELSALYTAFQAGKPSPLPPLGAQYADFAHWHRQWFEGGEAARQSDWWLTKLRDAQLFTGLPLDHPRPSGASANSASVEFTVPTFLTDAFHSLSQQAGVTLFISLLAAFQSLLYAYTRQEKIATGTIVSNRRLAETEAMIGSFANNILIASDFSSGMTFHKLLQQVAKTSREAYANQDLPFERLLGKLNPGLTANPLFRVMFVLHQHQSQSGSTAGLVLADLQVEKLPDVKVLSKYDLELVMVEHGGKLSGLFVYNADIFEPATIEALRDNFFQVLKQVTATPELALTELPSFATKPVSNNSLATSGTQEYTAPRTPGEAAITRVWQDVFGIERIGIHDHFTELGGHSLLAIRLLAALKQELDLDIRLGGMDTFPTIAELAASDS